MKLYPFLSITALFLIIISCSSEKRSHKNVHFDVIKNTVYSKEDSTFYKALKKDEEDKQNAKIAKMQQKIDRENAGRIFPDFSFDEVIAYDYDGEMESFGIEIIQNNKLTPYKKKAVLSPKQIMNLIADLNAETTYGGSKAICFNPHLGIVFYSKKRVVAYISICFECNYLVSSKLIPVTEKKIIAIYDDLVVFDSGFSELGVEKLSALCHELDFSHCK
jgi:hypothetical protein